MKLSQLMQRKGLVSDTRLAYTHSGLLAVTGIIWANLAFASAIMAQSRIINIDPKDQFELDQTQDDIAYLMPYGAYLNPEVQDKIDEIKQRFSFASYTIHYPHWTDIKFTSACNSTATVRGLTLDTSYRGDNRTGIVVMGGGTNTVDWSLLKSYRVVGHTIYLNWKDRSRESMLMMADDDEVSDLSHDFDNIIDICGKN